MSTDLGSSGSRSLGRWWGCSRSGRKELGWCRSGGTTFKFVDFIDEFRPPFLALASWTSTASIKNGQQGGAEGRGRCSHRRPNGVTECGLGSTGGEPVVDPSSSQSPWKIILRHHIIETWPISISVQIRFDSWRCPCRSVKRGEIGKLVNLFSGWFHCGCWCQWWRSS